MDLEHVKLKWEDIMSISYIGIPCYVDTSPRVTMRPEDNGYLVEILQL